MAPTCQAPGCQRQTLGRIEGCLWVAGVLFAFGVFQVVVRALPKDTRLSKIDALNAVSATLSWGPIIVYAFVSLLVLALATKERFDHHYSAIFFALSGPGTVYLLASIVA